MCRIAAGRPGHAKKEATRFWAASVYSGCKRSIIHSHKAALKKSLGGALGAVIFL